MMLQNNWMYNRNLGCYLRLIILKPLIEFLQIICCVFWKKDTVLVQTFYNGSDTKRCVHYCGWLSDSVNSGIHLGCPFPPLAFVLAIELLTIKIRDVQKLKGIRNWSLNNVPIYKILLRLLCMQMMFFFFWMMKMTCGMLLMSFTSSLSFLAEKLTKQRHTPRGLVVKKKSKKWYWHIFVFVLTARKN